MNRTTRIEDLGRFENAVIGSNHYIEEGVEIGFPYHEKCGPTRIGDDCTIHSGTIHSGTIVYGDVHHRRSLSGWSLRRGEGRRQNG